MNFFKTPTAGFLLRVKTSKTIIMQLNKDKAPIPNSCTLIDEIRDYICDKVPDKKHRNEVLGKLEKLRKANRKLREWGNIEHQRAEWILGIRNGKE